MRMYYSPKCKEILDQIGAPDNWREMIAEQVAGAPRVRSESGGVEASQDGADSFLRVHGVFFSFRRDWDQGVGWIVTDEEINDPATYEEHDPEMERIMQNIAKVLGHEPTALNL